MPKKNIDSCTLREATLDDLLNLVYQRRVMFIEATGIQDEEALDRMDTAYKKYIEKNMPEGNFKAWFINKNDAIVAGGAISIYEQPPRPQDDTLRYIYVHSVYTEPEYRHQGFAKKIMEAIINWCRENGFKTLTLHAVEASKQLYSSFGFSNTTEMRLFL